MDRRDDGPDWLPERLADLFARDEDAPREAVDEVPSLDLHLLAVRASGMAAPSLILTSSACRSPISRL
jgi:hypothetical protein